MVHLLLQIQQGHLAAQHHLAVLLEGLAQGVEPALVGIEFRRLAVGRGVDGGRLGIALAVKHLGLAVGLGKDEGLLAVVRMDARSKAQIKPVNNAILEACKEKIERDRRRGIKNRPVRAMVVGIPNVGKSTFINSFAGKACAKTGNKPGVTKGKQWIRLNKSVELLDTPGILWPKFEDQSVGLKLALIGSIKDEILNIDEMSLELIRLLQRDPVAEQALCTRYELTETEDAVRMLEQIATNRSCIKKGGELDYSKAAALLLDEFRSGIIGRMTLERPEEYGA